MKIERSDKIEISGKEGPWKFIITKESKDAPYEMQVGKHVQGKWVGSSSEGPLLLDERGMRGLREMLKQVQLPKTPEEVMGEPDPGKGKNDE